MAFDGIEATRGVGTGTLETGDAGTGKPTLDAPVLLLETYLPRPDRFGAFVDGLLAGLCVDGAPARWRAYRSHDGEAVVVLTEFVSTGARDRWLGGQLRRMQQAQLRPLLEHALSRSCAPISGAAPEGDASLRRPAGQYRGP